MPRTCFLQAGLVALSTLALFAARPANAQLSFRLDTFDVPMQGSGGSGASGISASGDISGTYLDSHDVNHGYIRSANGTFTTVDYPGTGNNTLIFYNSGINSAGYVTGAALDSSFNYITNFIYNSNTGKFLTPNINDQLHTTFDYTALQNINEAGIVAVQYGNFGKKTNAASYNIETDMFTLIPDISGYDNEIQAIGPNGEQLVTLGSLTDDTYQGSITQIGMTPMLLNFPGASSTSSDGITTTGLIIGNYQPPTSDPGNRNAYIYDSSNGSYTSIAVPGAVDTELFGGNNDTQFVGYYLTADGVYHNLLVTVVPEPGSVALLTGMAFSGGLFLRRRARTRRAS